MLHTDHCARTSGARVKLTSEDLEALRGLRLPFFGITEQDREDAIGDALLSAVTSFDPARGQLRSFVHKCAWNRSLNQLRESKRQRRNVELDAGHGQDSMPVYGSMCQRHDRPFHKGQIDIPDPKSEIPEPAEQPEWLENTLKRCELLTMSQRPGIRMMAADSIVALRRLKDMADGDDLDNIHSKALWEGPLHDAVVASGHPISAKSMWDVRRFVNEQVKENLSEQAE